MDETDQENTEGSNRQRNEIFDTLEALKLKNAELKETMRQLKLENYMCKANFYALDQRVNSVNEWLEKNATIFHGLFEETKTALRMGRSSAFNSTLISPLSLSPRENPREKTVASASPKPGPSGVAFSRRKFHIERLNVKELAQSLEESRERSVAENRSAKEGNLNVIAEENNQNEVTSATLSNETNLVKEVCVRLSRLSSNTVQEYLKKSHQNIHTNSLNVSSSFSSTLTPDLTSTPLKLETMKQLGLYYNGIQPINNNNFINLRRRENVKQNEDTTSSSGTKRSKSEPEDSPINKKKTKIQKSETNKKKKQTSKKEPKLVLRSPKIRKAKPKVLKEPPLGTKLRNG